MALTKPEILKTWTKAARGAVLGAALTIAPIAAAYGQGNLPDEGSFVTAEEALQISQDCGMVVIHEGQNISGTQASAEVLRVDVKIPTISLKGPQLDYATINICGARSPYHYSQEDIISGTVTKIVRTKQPAIKDYMLGQRGRAIASAPSTPSAEVQ